MTTTSSEGFSLASSIVGQTRRFFRLIGGAAILLIALYGGGVKASTTEVIYSFAGEDDGEYTDTDVAIDAAGNLYGTSVLGGEFGGGTVWQLSPVGGGWVHTVLYSFTGGADGGEPYKGVTLDAAGNLYGTAVTGGSGSCEGGCGVTYKLTKSGTTWTQSVIHAFTGGADGSGPGARVAVDNRGNVYGMTPTGGANGLGINLRASRQVEWLLGFSSHPHFYRRFRWIIRLGRQVTFTWWAHLRRGDDRRGEWCRCRLRTDTDSKWRMGFQDPLLIQGCP